MKKLIPIIVILLVLMSCLPAATAPAMPTAVPFTETPVSSPTLTPSNTPNPTITPTPTATEIPPLPETIEFTFDESISEQARHDLKDIVNQAYWFYIGIGCSPKGFRAHFYDGEGGYADFDRKGVFFEDGAASLFTDPTKTTGSISHEMVHVMCQIAFVQRDQLGAIDLRWLTEALANYFSTWERITNAGSYFGFTDISKWQQDNLLNPRLCDTPLSALEPSNAHTRYPDAFGPVGEAAVVLLAKMTPDGNTALLNYYKLLNEVSNEKAFQQAFGRTKGEFYQQYQSECRSGFPTLVKHPEGIMQMQGRITFADGSTPYERYMITFCNIKKTECGPSTTFYNDGTFTIFLEKGAYYTLSINPANGGEPIGWYNSKGLVKDNSCAGVIQANENVEISIIVDLKNISGCNVETPTPAIPAGTVPVQGNVVFKDGNQDLTPYLIFFCNFQTSECGPSAVIHEDGTFIVYLEPDTYYRASLNPITEGDPIGWYNSKGLVKDSSCAGLIQVKEGLQISIMVDLKNIISCNR